MCSAITIAQDYSEPGEVLNMHILRNKSILKSFRVTTLAAISCFLLLLVEASQFGAAISSKNLQQHHSSTLTHPQSNAKILLLEKTNHLQEFESHSPLVDSFEKRSYHDNEYLERRSTGATLNGGKTQVAISLERVKNPDDADGYKKKKKFPVVWLRNQYPFNKYYKKKYNKQGSKYPEGDLAGQYSSESVEVLDPNPSTWVKIPDHPTASIKFQKQSSPFNFNQNLPPPASLIPSSLYSTTSMHARPQIMDYHHHHQPHHHQTPQAHLHHQQPYQQPAASSGLMESESQQSDHSLPSSSAAASTKGGGESGYGGISLSFGNGRSISFGGGQGLTIGGRAGAISIGGNKGGSGDNQQAASGYSSAEATGKHAAAYKPNAYGSSGSGSGMDDAAGSNNAYGDKSYVNKHPTMSMDFPRRGKKIVHANLDGAPVKIRLHSSPRVKITTGSRDPLEKPSDEELSEDEEDIFEPPVPFEKKNSTMDATNSTSTDMSNMNGTSTSTGTNGTSDGNMTTINPMLLTNDFEYSSKGQRYNQQYQQNAQYFNQQQFHQHHQYQVPFDDRLPGNYELNPRPAQVHYGGAQAGPYRQQNHEIHQEYVPIASNGKVTHGNPYGSSPAFSQGPPSHPPVAGYPPQHQHSYGNQRQPQVGASRPAPVHQVLQQPHYLGPQPQQVGPVRQMGQPPMMQEQQPVPMPEQLMPMSPIPPVMPAMQPMQAAPDGSLNEARPAVNQWRQFSQDARQQVVRTAQPLNQLPQHLDPNPRFYNGSPNGGQQIHPNSIAEAPPMIGGPIEGKEMVETAASSRHYAQLPGVPHQQPAIARQQSIQHPQFSPATAYQLAEPARPPVQRAPMRQAQNAPHNRAVYHSQKVSEQVASSPLAPRKTAPDQRQVQAQESNYYQQQAATGSYGSSGGQDDGTRTYTFGNGGISSSYGAGGSGEYDSTNAAAGSGSRVSDNFDQKSYQAKVEKFEPDAHDKRERSKVVLFLRPRISIHQANSSTTTKRPKNQQRFINVVNRPIFLNNTNNMTHHEDEEFIDPDLKEPMELESYGYGYGYGGYGNSYGKQKGNSSTTKKPKVKKPKSTTTSTTPSPESTTTELPSTTTSAPETTTGEPSSTETSSSSTTTESSSSSSSSTTESSTSSEGSDTTSSESPSSSTSTTSGSDSSESPTTETPPVLVTEREMEGSSSTVSSAEPSSSTTESSSSSTASGATSEPPSEVETFSPSSTSEPETSPPDEAADLVASATTESSSELVGSASTAASTILPRTTRVSGGSSASSSSSTTSLAPSIVSSLSLTVSASSGSSSKIKQTPTVASGSSSSGLPELIISSTTEMSTSSSMAPQTEISSSSSSTPSSLPATPSSSSPDDSDTIVEQQNPSKRSPAVWSASGSGVKGSLRAAASPMLLNPELIDKLMSNKTLVNLMSSQLKRVVDSVDLSSEHEKRHIVRQVFEQMMEDKVDFSMNNVRLAVKTVSSSYKAAAEKQRKQRTASTVAHLATDQKKSSSSKATELFGRRAAGGDSTTTEQDTLMLVKAAPKASRLGDKTLSTSTKLTSLNNSSSSGQASKLNQSNAAIVQQQQQRQRTGGKSASSPTGDPIVVVLVPQEKA